MGDALKEEIPNEHCVKPVQSVSKQCSCSQCESATCFAIRNFCGSCSCEDCEKSKTCLFYNNTKQIKQSYSDQIISVYLNAAKCATKDIVPEELTENDINYESDRKKVIITNRLPPNSLDEYLDRLLETTTLKSKCKLDSLSGYINSISGKKQESLNNYMRKLRTSKLTSSINEIKATEYVNNSKKHEKRKEEHFTHVHNVMLSCPTMAFQPSIAKHSSNVLNDTRKDSPDCGTYSTSALSEHKENKKLNFNIFEKIKDAYNACTCVACECISPKNNKRDVCECKPCDCADCMKYMDSVKLPKLHRHHNDLKCTCSRFNSKCKRHTKKQKDCSCKPCECAQCQNNDFKKPCDCEPCQCIQCKPTIKHNRSLRTLVVAPVAENFQHNPCRCTPCNCIECVYGPSTLTSKFPRALATDSSNRARCHCVTCPDNACKDGDDSCQCERLGKFTNKPLGEDKHGFGIRSTPMRDDIFYQAEDVKESNIQDTIRDYSSHTKFCNCEECECITCDCKEDAFNAIIKSSRLFSYGKRKINQTAFHVTKHSINNICDDKPCQCQACIRKKKTNVKYHKVGNVSTESMCICMCNKCKRSGADSVNNKIAYEDSCRCITCRGEHGFTGDFEIVRQAFGARPIKRGDVLTPKAHQTKVQKLMLAKVNLPITPAINKTKSIHKDSILYIKREMFNYAKISKHNYNVDVTPKPSFIVSTDIKANKNKIDVATQLRKNQMDKCNVMKHDAYVQCREWENDKPLLKNNFTDKISGSYISVFSSTDTTSKTSCCKENDNDVPILGNKNKSWESSCNSSGHDQPDYLIRFPKSTTKTCLEDVLKANLGNEINLTSFDIIPKKNILKTKKDKSQTSDDNSITRRLIYSSTSLDTKESNKIQENGSKDSEEMEPPMNTQNGYVTNISQFSRKTMKDSNIKQNKSDIVKSNTTQLPCLCKNHYGLGKSSYNDTMQAPPVKSSVASKIFRKNKSNKNGHYGNYHSVHFSEVHLTRNAYTYHNTSDGDLPEDMIEENSCTQPKLSSLLSNNLDWLNMDEDYQRVYETLKDAKLFSLHLLKLLATYEKANKEFEKVSDKFKVTEVLISREECCKEQNVCDFDLENMNEILGQPLKSPGLSDTTTREYIITENATSGISQKLGFTDISQSIADHQLLNTLNTVYNTGEHNFDVNSEETSNQKEQCRRKRNMNTTENEDDSLYYDANDFQTKSNKEDVKRKEERLHRKYRKKHCNHTKRSFNNIEKVNLENLDPNYSTPTESTFSASVVLNHEDSDGCTTDNISVKNNQNIQTVRSKPNRDLSLIMKKLDCIFGSVEKGTMASSDKQDSQSSKEDEDEIKPWPMLKKNFSFTSKPFKKKKDIFPTLAVQVEKTEQSISLQTNAEFQHGDDSYNKIKSLLTECHSSFTRSSTPDTSDLESQKVKFLLVRKMSDHTVLLKWSRPQNLTDIQGFEILVDGRPVQRVFKPTDCMAIVTCLPHTDKILLTIRTIMSFVSESGHHPITTIIYRPRVE